MIQRETLEALPIGGMKVGEQGNWNHSDCPAGIDTRRRLYIKRKDNRLWVAFCHNCGESGALKSGVLIPTMADLAHQLRDVVVIKPDDPNTSTFEMPGAVTLPDDFTQDPSFLDTWVLRRLWDNHSTVEVAVKHGWGFSPSRNQMITPIYHKDGNMGGYQARNAPGILPKCITTYAQGHKGYPLFYRRLESNILIIVEDPLSAMRLHEETFVTSVALLGTHLNAHALSQIIHYVKQEDVKHITIWMDADIPGKVAGVKIHKELRSLFGKDVNILVSAQPEPKLIEHLKV